MSEWPTTHVSGNLGPAHAGTGDLHTTQNFYGPIPDPKRRSPQSQATDDLLWLAQRFVYPAGFGTARRALESHRTVFLKGAPGSGRVAAAKVLLWELDRGAKGFHDLPLEIEENESSFDQSHIGANDRVWADLSEVAGPVWEQVQPKLASLRRTVQERSAYLVAVLPDGTGNLWPEFSQYRVRIERPPLREALLRYLRLDGIHRPDPLPSLPFLGENHPVRDVPRYIQLIKEARDRASGRGDFAAWCDTAYRALSGRENEVAQLVAAMADGRQRALLLATAMLHGAHADSIHQGSAALLRKAAHPPGDSPMLERATLDRQFRDIKAGPDASGNVTFRELGYDSAVRSFFWAHMPDIRKPLREWVLDITDSAGLTDGERENLVTRFADLCRGERYRSAWTWLVEKWTAEPAADRMMKAAILALKHGLQDQEYGRIFRRQIYEWSRGPLPGRLAEAIVAACEEQMAITHPDEALVRLHHVARRERGTHAREALAALVREDRRLLRLMMNRVCDPERRTWRADALVFLDAADPEAFTDLGSGGIPLIAEHTVRHQLPNGWSLAFTDLPPESWRTRVGQWLRCAAQDGPHRSVLLDVLIEGSQQRASVLSHLYAMTRVRDLRTVSDLVLRKINAVQGVALR